MIVDQTYYVTDDLSDMTLNEVKAIIEALGM